MAEQPVVDQREETEDHENHELPRGALLITLTYLAICIFKRHFRM